MAPQYPVSIWADLFCKKNGSIDPDNLWGDPPNQDPSPVFELEVKPVGAADYYVLDSWDVHDSPDSDGNLQPNWCDVALADFIWFAGHSAMSGSRVLGDYNGSGASGLDDFIAFGDHWGTYCQRYNEPD